MKKKESDVSAGDVLTKFEDLFGSQTFEGRKTPDKNFEGNFLLIESSTRMYSFNLNDVINEENLGDGKVKITMRKGCFGMVTAPYQVGADDFTLLSYSENKPLPKPTNEQRKFFASQKDVSRLIKTNPPSRTLAAAAAKWSNDCSIGDDEANDCAHFLSDAFIKAGFNELKKVAADPSITEWCDWNDREKNEAARPIRAKDMWAWFQRMAVRTKRTKPSREGFWAVFQWDPSYSGGHVLLYDSDADRVYGTGVFWQWQDQFFYQW